MADKDRCFIITPIGDDTDPIRRHIDGIIDAAIRPALGDKYELVVAHKISEPGSITKQVINEIYSCKLAIANLTNRNPNVMYELAFRHSLGKPVIMIAEKGTPLPSDIIMERTIFYQNDAKGVLELRDNLIEAESKIDFDKISSPIYDILHEYNRDAQIVQISEKQLSNESNEDNTNILKYILFKLNNLDDSIKSIRRSQTADEEDDYPSRMIFSFAFSTISQPYQKEKLLSKLQTVTLMEPNVRVQNISVDLDEKNVLVYLVLYGRIPIPDIYNFFLKILKEYGFVNARATRTKKANGFGIDNND